MTDNRKLMNGYITIDPNGAPRRLVQITAHCARYPEAHIKNVQSHALKRALATIEDTLWNAGCDNIETNDLRAGEDSN
jgi:hypothetical protein